MLELFLWFENPDTYRIAANEGFVEQIRGEVGGVVIYCFFLTIQLDFDLRDAVANSRHLLSAIV